MDEEPVCLRFDTVGKLLAASTMLEPGTRVLILGGTHEAARIAEKLHLAGHHVTTSLAGRTREPEPVCGAVRIGGFGGPDGLARWMQDHMIEALIDATHPFAPRISRNAERAAQKTGTVLFVFSRPAWEKLPGDNWLDIATLEDAAAAIPAGARVLLALGRQHIAPFAMRGDVQFVIRMVDPPAEPLPFADHMVMTGKPGNVAEETDLLRRLAISHVVCRNSGGKSSYGKIEAARALGIPVIMIRRPSA